MLVRTLTAWGGHDFNYSHGDTVELADNVARDRIAAGLAEPVQDAEPAAEPAKRRRK